MTTIAYKDGVMAADSGSWFSNVVYRGAIKIAKGPDGSLHGVCGNAAEAGNYLKWVNDGMVGDPPKPEPTNREEGHSAFLALVAPPSGDVLLVLSAFGWENHNCVPYLAIGSGSEMAIGAMAAGADAAQAVAIVAEHSDYAALPVRTIRRD